MTTIPADAYVVPHFNGGISLGGVGGSVARAGGLTGIRSYERFLDSLPRAADSDGAAQNWGDVFLTESGGGSSSHLLHAVTAGGRKGVNEEVQAVNVATLNALRTAQNARLDSVVFPALGTGIIGNLSNSLSALAILGAVETFRGQSSGNLFPRMVTVAIYCDRLAYISYVEMLRMGPLTKAARQTAARSDSRAMDWDRVEREMQAMLATIAWAKRSGDAGPGKVG